MSGEDVLLTLGEVAIAVAGFSSIVAVFGRRAQGTWSPVESFRLATLIANAVGPALLSFLPFVLENLGLSARAVWASSSSVLLSFVIAQVAWVIAGAPRRFRESGESIRLWVALTANTCCLSAGALQVLNIAGIVFQQELGPYLAGLLLLLAVAILQFCILVFSPAGRPAA